MKKFATSLDTTSKVITWAAFALVLVLSFIVFSAYKDSANSVKALTAMAIGPSFLLVILIAMYGLKPAFIIVNNDGIVIDRKIMPVSIPFSQIKAIRIIP